jgi:hypothetical protein
MKVSVPRKPCSECAGATYHTALWARERDRLRQDVLEHLGWRFHRIWSTDWFYNRRAEIERLRAALAVAREAAQQGVGIDGANRVQQPTAVVTEPDPIAVELPEVVARPMPTYQRSVFPVNSSHEPHEVAVLLVGLSAVKASQCIAALALRVDRPVINLNAELSAALLDVPERQRPLKAHKFVGDIIDSGPNDILLFDHIDLLFAPSLRLDALALLKGFGGTKR